jgi:monofunctional biosynthetic peptidoglycan transglycosylase
MVSLTACRAGLPTADATDGFNISPASAEAGGTTTERGETHMAQEGKPLFDFQGQDEAARWVRVNDGVMGGLSQSEMRFTAEGTALFEGTLSLDNNGGFASVRTIPDDFALGGYAGLSVRVKGDGRRYMLRLRTDRYLDGPAYESGFDTVAETWVTVRVPFRDFVPTFRGRRLRNMPELDGADVRQIGFMLADKQAGSFRLEIDWIRAYEDM